jgi:uncharacterized membrane protein
MLVICLTVIVVIISIISSILISKKCKKLEDNNEWRKSEKLINYLFLPLLTMVLSGFILIGEISLINTNTKKQESINTYNNLIEFINCYGTNGIETEIIEMNNKIDENKLYHDNIWIGVWYSKEIGNLKEINCINK